MTSEERKEAIEYLKKYKELDKQLFQIAPFTSVSHDVLVKSLRHWDTAIQALEEEPRGDAISRQAAIDANCYNCSIKANGGKCSKCDAVKAIEELPSVKPQEKTGHWIIKGQNLVDDFIPIGHFCSECGKQALLNPYGTHMENLSNYCSYCGADMKGDDNEDRD